MLERDIEDYLVKRVKELGGEVRKVKWIGRRSAPDRLVMLPRMMEYNATTLSSAPRRPRPARTIWVELKAPGKLATFPADFRERAQAREHQRMRELGQCVVVVDSIEGVEALLS